MRVGIKEVLEALANGGGPYPKPIYEEKQSTNNAYKVEIVSHKASTIKSETWEWIVRVIYRRVLRYISSQAKAEARRRFATYFNKLANEQGMRVVRFNMEDHEASILKPTMHAAGCNLELTEVVDRCHRFERWEPDAVID